MTRQKSEDRVVPEGGVMTAPTRGSVPDGGGKAIPVDLQVKQLELAFATAEHPQGPGVPMGGDASPLKALPGPKADANAEHDSPATIEEVVAHLSDALDKVAANRGAPGPDGETVAALRKRWVTAEPTLAAMLVEGSFRPGTIRRVLIPKPGGGERGLGIPNVIDRVVQEALRRVIEPLWEPTFHASSHGFRPKRSCHTAITEARRYVSAGYEWVVDLDLSKFFDRVNHQRLMARLAQRVDDRRLLVLVGLLLKAGVVMPDGLVVTNDEGVPQGGPLSPLLSNIVLDEFDRELGRRGHRFVRYADDVNIFVRSERAGHRVMASVTHFLQNRLRLKVNVSKSAVARPEDRHFLGFRLRRDPSTGEVDILLSERSKRRAMERIRELTPRNYGWSLISCIQRLNVYVRGWYGFFRLCSASEDYSLRKLDAHIRRRLRAIQLKHWKTKKTIAHKLVALGVNRKTAWRRVYIGKRSLWALSHDPAVHRGLRNAYFAERGLVSIFELHRITHAPIEGPIQLTLDLGKG